VLAKRCTCLDGGSVAVDEPVSGCAVGECNSAPFDLSSTDRSAGYCAPIVACSSNQVTCIAKILDARLRSKPPERTKVIHLLDQDFPDLAIVIQSDCRRLNAVRTWRHDELAPTAHG